MRHRVFIAINPPEDIKKKLAGYQDKWPELPARWTKKDNLHITLEFLGYMQDEEILEALKTAKEIASKHNSFNVKLTKICYGPPNKIPYSRATLETGRPAEGGNRPPRMIWTVGEKIKELDIVPHITLGRIKTWQWKQIEPEERPDIEEDINLNFEVNSIEVMESVLGRGGPKYTVLESFPLNDL